MNTYGWDIVTALSLDAINNQLKNNFAKLLNAFDFQDQLSPDCSIVVNGNFKSWQIVPGGSGTDVDIALTVNNGNYYYTDTSNLQNSKSFLLDGLVVTIELSVDFLPSTTNGNQQELQFNFRANNGNIPDNTSVFCKGVVTPGASGIDMVSKALIGNAITQCIFNNAANITYIFASLSTTGCSGLPAPDHFSFLFSNTENSSNSYFSILSTVISDYQQTQSYIDPTLFDNSSNIFLSLSEAYFLKYVIMPQLPSVFKHGTGSESFSYTQMKILNNTVTSITNTCEIDMPAVKSGAIWYTPIITGLGINTKDTLLQTSIVGTCHISPGIDLSFTAVSNSSVTIQSEGICFSPVGTPDISTNIDKSTWVIIAEAVLAGIIEDIVDAITNCVSRGITDGLNGAVSAFSMQALNPNFINWTDFNITNLVSGGLGGNLFLRGN